MSSATGLRAGERGVIGMFTSRGMFVGFLLTAWVEMA